MESKLISKGKIVAQLSIEYSADEFENAVVESYKRNKGQFTINGFRKGKAPRKIIEMHYGEDIFYEDALNELLRTGYPNALAELGLDVIDQPRIDTPDIKKGEPVVLNMTVSCFPEEDVKDYFGAKVEKIETEVTDDDVQAELERVQKRQSRLENVEDRPSEKDDTVVIDYEGTIDGEKFNGGSAEKFNLKLGSGQFIPGFEDQLIGKNAGDEVDVKVTFPEDYGAKDLAGKEAVFKTKIHEIKHEVLPEIDDDFASDVSEFETLDEYKADLKKKLQKEADDRNETSMKDAMLETIYEANDLDIPDVMISDEEDRILQEMDQQLRYQGISLDQYLRYMGKTRQELRNDYRDDAEKRVGTRIIIRNVIRQENIEATDEEVQKEIQNFADQYGQSADKVEEMVGKDNMRFFKEDAETKKAIDAMFDKAEFVEPEKKEPEEDKTADDADEKSEDK